MTPTMMHGLRMLGAVLIGIAFGAAVVAAAVMLLR